MLRNFFSYGKAPPCRVDSALISVLKVWSSQRLISTNTAINKSLRKSQFQKFDSETFSGRDTRALRGASDWEQPRERVPKPNHQEGIDVDDIAEFSKRKEHYRELNRARPTRRRIKRDTPGSALERPPTEPLYNYDPKPGGNRAARRAQQFGHKVDLPGLAGSNRAIKRATVHRRSLEKDVSRYDESVRVSYELRRPTRREQNRDDGHAISMPRGVQDDLKSFLKPSQVSFLTAQRDNSYNDDTVASKRRSTRHDAPRSRPFGGLESGRLRSDDRGSQHRESDMHLSIPYTTPASEFLYGTSVVTSALLASHRKLYKLYIYNGDNREARDQDKRIEKLARDRSVVIERVRGGWLRLMDKMSMGRPHNGYILEASPLPQLPVVGLRPVKEQEGKFHMLLDHQSREDEAINGTETQIKYETEFPRYPLVLLLDGILDPGNLGAILRTAFFLGVDAVAISSRSSAPLSPTALKASAGASENMPILTVNQPGKFIDVCKSFGWKICAAVAPKFGGISGPGRTISTAALHSPVQDHPCILLVGGEGEGLRWSIQSKADYKVGIDGRRIGQAGIDSLNVSVAAGLLCEAFLRKPVGSAKTTVSSSFKAPTNAATARTAGDTEEQNRIF